MNANDRNAAGIKRQGNTRGAVAQRRGNGSLSEDLENIVFKQLINDIKEYRKKNKNKINYAEKINKPAVEQFAKRQLELYYKLLNNFVDKYPTLKHKHTLSYLNKKNTNKTKFRQFINHANANN